MKLFQISILLCCVFTLQLHARSYPGHKKDFEKFFQGMSGENLEYVYKTISSGIDSREFRPIPNSKELGFSFVKMFKQEFGSLPSGNHRLIGHWGFSGAIPFNKEPYKTALAPYPKEKVIKLWQNFVQEEIRRTMEHTGLPKRQAQGLVGVIYDIHLLGDYSTKYTDPLPPPKYVEKDLSKNLSRLLGNNDSLRREIKAEFDKIPKNLLQKEYALEMRNILNRHPGGEKLYNRYFATFQEHSIFFDAEKADSGNSHLISADLRKQAKSLAECNSGKTTNPGKGLFGKKYSGALTDIATTAGFIIAHDAMRNGITWDTFSKAGLASAGALAWDVSLDKLDKAINYSAGKFASRFMKGGSAGKFASRLMGGGVVQTVLAGFFIGKSIYDYNKGNITQTDMLVEVGIVALTTAGTVFFTCTSGGAKVGAAIGMFFGGPPGSALGGAIGTVAGVVIGTAGGILTGGYTWYVEHKRQKNLLYEARLRAEWETENNKKRLEERKKELKKEAEALRESAWRGLLPAN